MTLSKKTLKKIKSLPEEIQAGAIVRAYSKKQVQREKSTRANYIARIKAQRNIRDQARAMGALDIASKAQIEIRYLTRKLAALRARV